MSSNIGQSLDIFYSTFAQFNIHFLRSYVNKEITNTRLPTRFIDYLTYYPTRDSLTNW